MSEYTKWEGLWQSKPSVYRGKVIAKKDIPNYARLIVRYNRFYEKDSSKPRFVYCFANGEAADSISLELVECEDDEYCFTRRGLQDLINRVACAAGGDGEYGMHIVEDFV